MKKICFFVLFVVILSSFALTACADSLGKNKRYVSEYRDGVFVGCGEHFSAEAVSGYRENPFKIDGVSSSDKVDFCIVTIKPTEYDPTRVYTYCVEYDGVKYEGEFVKHPFENSYSFEIPLHIKDAFCVLVDGENIELCSVKNEEYILPEKAFEIASGRLKNTQIVSKGDYEIYIRLINNPINASGGYFWYVAFVDINQETAAVLIEPVSMEIVAVRE